VVIIISEVRVMKRLTKWLLLAAAPLVLALVMPAAAGKAPPTRSVPTGDSEVTGLAFDGARVVYAVRPYGVAYPSVHVWNVLSGRASLVHRRGGGASFAVATNRVAWIDRAGSPIETDEYLLTTPVPGLNLRQLASAVRYDNPQAQDEVGDWLSGLAGSGNVIAVSSWTTGPAYSLLNGRLSLVGKRGLQQIVAGPEAIVVESVDAGRIAVVRSMGLWPSHYRLHGGEGSVGVYSTSGRLLVEVNRGTAREAALSGGNLAVLTTKNRIALYKAKTGTFVRSWPVSPRAAHLDLHGGIAIYSVYPKYTGPRALHALQLKTGKDVILARGLGAYPYTGGDDAQFDRLGVVYSVDKWLGTPKGRIVFVPMANVLAALRKG
jgi:hypothetical protein